MDFYAANQDARKAAIAAGYSEKTAGAKGCALLKDHRVNALVEDFRQERRESAILTFDERARILSDVARGNVADYMGGEGGVVNIQDESLNGPALASVEQKALFGANGGPSLGVATKIKLRDPIAAIKEQAEAELAKLDREAGEVAVQDCD